MKKPWFNFYGDSIHYQNRDCETVGDYVDGFFTILRDVDNGDVVGVVIYSPSYWFSWKSFTWFLLRQWCGFIWACLKGPKSDKQHQRDLEKIKDEVYRKYVDR